MKEADAVSNDIAVSHKALGQLVVEILSQFHTYIITNISQVCSLAVSDLWN
jgi:hypothetical protein